MTEKKKIDEGQIWMALITIVPVVFLGNVGSQITNDGINQLLYSGLFGGIGGLIGGIALVLTKNKNRIVKTIAFILVLVICGFTLSYFSKKPTDSEIIAQHWVTQKIGRIEFDSPTKLKLITSEIPEIVKSFYSEINLYTDEEKDRVTTFLESKILIDTLDIDDAFSNALDGFLQKMKVNIDDVELEVLDADNEELSAIFSYKLNNKIVNGYGLVYLTGRTLESIWLIPLKRGFSREYIEEFDAGIYLDYE